VLPKRAFDCPGSFFVGERISPVFWEEVRRAEMDVVPEKEPEETFVWV